jgi:hypothetical protein
VTEAVEIGAVTASTARALLRLRGDTAGRALAELLVRRYQSLTNNQKIGFFRLLLDEFGADRSAVDSAIANYQTEPTELTLADWNCSVPSILHRVVLQRCSICALSCSLIVAMFPSLSRSRKT